MAARFAKGPLVELTKHLLSSFAVALPLVAITTVCLIGVKLVVNLQHISSAYLIPVLLAAIWFGMTAAILVAIGGVAASAFFFYAPIYDFRVADPAQLLDLPLFIVVATVTSQLAARSRAHAMLARKREAEIRTLYAFSKRLAVATNADDIYSAIRDHVSTMTGCRVVHCAPDGTTNPPDTLPNRVRPAARQTSSTELPQSARAVYGAMLEDDWLLRPISAAHSEFGVLAIEVGNTFGAERKSVQQRIDAVLADASATLERLDIGHAIGEAKLRSEAETLREALIGSVSHDLRTPLASIIGSASVLLHAPALVGEPRLAGLARVISEEAQRLNDDIQNLLDATRISAKGVSPQIEWTDVLDIINAALDRHRLQLAPRRLTTEISPDLPLVRVDAILTEQALAQIIHNAMKYSPPESPIKVSASAVGGSVVVTISDEGAGFEPEEKDRIFDRFYRGARHKMTTTGSGLGLWIARAFLVASGARVEADWTSGTIVTVWLPAPPLSEAAPQDDLNDE
jgi:two-component system sensor histidine kinase KdpD